MKPRIAILTHNMARGGAERFISHLLRALKDDFEIHLLLFDDTIEYELPDNQVIEYVEHGFQSRQNLSSIFRLPIAARRVKKYCESNGIELLVSFLNRPNFTAGMAKFLGLRIPLIISERVYTPLWFKEHDLRGIIAKRLVTWLYSYADTILPNSEGTRMALEEHYGIKTRYWVIRNIIDRDDIERQSNEAVDNVSFNRFTFINVASFSPQKGHREMVAAFSSLERTDVQLIFVGTGVMRAQIQELVNSLKLEKEILFVGYQDNPFKYLARSHCFLLASDFEGFPNVLTEAMACGLPVISTDCETGPRELLAPSTYSNGKTVENAKFGILVPVGDVPALAEAMLQMVGNSDKRNCYQQLSRERAKDFDVRIVIKELKVIFEGHLKYGAKAELK